MNPKKESSSWSLFAQPKWIFWFVRGIIFLSFVLWMLLSPQYEQRIWMPLSFFVVYSIGAFVFTGRSKMPAEKLYFLTSLVDIMLITSAAFVAGAKGDGFSLLYFLVVPFASYAAGLIPGISLAFLSSVFYLSLNAGHLASMPVSFVLIRTLALLAVAAAVGVVVQDMKGSKSKLLGMFDVLNQRTSELEKSQAQIETIYETSRTLGEILNLDEVVAKVLNIARKILGYRFFSIFILSERDALSLVGEIKEGETVKHAEPEVTRLKGVHREIVSNAKPVRVFDVTKDPGFELNPEGMRSFMAVPMVSRGKVIGVMDARSTRMGAFLDQDEKILSILAGSAALAIENALLHQKTQELTVMDDLTGLYNFRYFTRKLAGEIMRAERYHLPLSIIMIDIDWFKRCNDTYGHLFGNRVLQGLAVGIRECVREVDVICRYGGEEFAVILPQTKKADAQTIGERIRCRVESDEFSPDRADSPVKVTVSLGIASFPENGRTSKELIAKVDQALYKAKGRGKNLVCTV
jgi:diguanylate cyclase (GGDEF)-like protein